MTADTQGDSLPNVEIEIEEPDARRHYDAPMPEIPPEPGAPDQHIPPDDDGLPFDDPAPPDPTAS